MTNQYYFLQRITGGDSNLRAADADRERIAERLRNSHAEGRLDLTEFQERLERCYESKTLGELGELVRDLPRESEQAGRGSSGWIRRWSWGLPRLAPILIALVLIAALTGHRHQASWLWIPLLFVFWRMAWWRRTRWMASSKRYPGERI